jgi:hypothetical protein
LTAAIPSRCTVPGEARLASCNLLLDATVDLPQKIRLPTSRHAAAFSHLGGGFLPVLLLIQSFPEALRFTLSGLARAAARTRRSGSADASPLGFCFVRELPEVCLARAGKAAVVPPKSGNSANQGNFAVDRTYSQDL